MKRDPATLLETVTYRSPGASVSGWNKLSGEEADQSCAKHFTVCNVLPGPFFISFRARVTTDSRAGTVSVSEDGGSTTLGSWFQGHTAKSESGPTRCAPDSRSETRLPVSVIPWPMASTAGKQAVRPMQEDGLRRDGKDSPHWTRDLLVPAKEKRGDWSLAMPSTPPPPAEASGSMGGKKAWGNRVQPGVAPCSQGPPGTPLPVPSSPPPPP
nr:uncharacterized protein LOC105862044 [Microcebus murinus]XP_012603490.1 uncharacterized protein LOC105862044 [Microcebus murinus]